MQYCDLKIRGQKFKRSLLSLATALFWKLRPVIIITLIIWLVLLGGVDRIQAEEWQTYTTDNFEIHFTADLTDLAFKTADIAEEVHEAIAADYIPQREDKTHIIIKDDSDEASGLADPSLVDQIIINPNHPVRREFGSRHDSWLRLLLAHEYTHILHLNMRSDSLESLRNIVGDVPNIMNPNFFQTWWMLEGYPIMEESDLSGGGRAEDAIYDMYMRMAFLEDDVYYFDQIHGQYNLASWPPGGMSVYLYGASFFSYLAAEYSREELIKVSEEFANHPSRGVNRAFQTVFERGAQELYQDWQEYKQEKYEDQADSIKAAGLETGERLTRGGYYSYQPVWDEKNEEIIYYHEGNYFPGLRSIDPAQGDDKNLLTGAMVPSGLEINSAGELFFASAEKDFFDIYFYDLATGEKEQLTREERARDPVVLDEAGEESLIYVRQEAGTTEVRKMKNLTEVKGEGENPAIETVLGSGEKRQYYSPALSPAGDKLALVIWKPGGYQDLYLYDFARETLKQVTDNQIAINSPTWTEEGDKVLFSADKEGLANIYAYDLQTENFYQVTNVLGGAFDPLVIDEEEIIYVGYDSEGYNLYSLEYQPENWREVEFPGGAVQEEVSTGLAEEKLIEEERAAKSKEEVEDYNVFAHLAPRYYLPNIFFSTGGSYLGLNIGGRDPLDRINYQAGIAYEGGDYPLSFNWDFLFDFESWQLLQSSQRRSGRNLPEEDLTLEDRHRLQLQIPLWEESFSAAVSGGGLQYLRREYEDTGPSREEYRLFALGNYLYNWGFDDLNVLRDLYFQANLDYFADDYYLSGQFDWREIFDWQDYELNLRTSLAYGQLEESFTLGGLTGRYPVRGYQAGERVRGNELLYFRSQLSRKLLNIKRGSGLSPLFFDNISGSIFVEGGRLEATNKEEFLAGFGGELSLDLELSYGLYPLEINLGAARRYDEAGWQIYLTPGYEF